MRSGLRRTELSRDDFSLTYVEGGNNSTNSFVVCAVDGIPRASSSYPLLRHEIVNFRT